MHAAKYFRFCGRRFDSFIIPILGGVWAHSITLHSPSYMRQTRGDVNVGATKYEIKPTHFSQLSLGDVFGLVYIAFLNLVNKRRRRLITHFH